MASTGKFTEPVYSPVHQEQIVAGEMTQNVVENSDVQAQVVVSLPPLEELTKPVFNQIHQEQIAAGETTMSTAETPVVKEQVIVQEIPEVDAPFPSVEEFTEPVYNPVHQEQIVAGEITLNIVEHPAVQEQVTIPQVSIVERIEELCSFTGLMNPQISTTSLEASQVVGSLPPVEEFTEPVYNPVHQEQIVAGEMTQNIIENSDVQEQVIEQEIPEVVAPPPPPPPVAEFTEPVYNPVHQEQIVAGAVKQTIIENSVVQEQVIVQEIPEVVDSAADKAVSLDDLRRILRDVNAALCANRLWHPGEHS